MATNKANAPECLRTTTSRRCDQPDSARSHIACEPSLPAKFGTGIRAARGAIQLINAAIGYQRIRSLIRLTFLTATVCPDAETRVSRRTMMVSPALLTA